MTTTNEAAPETSVQSVDVLIIGAGLSGIGAGVHLQTEAPGTTYAIVEARESSGGTWDLFRYPGIRSDSDMFTLGYAFKPWTEGPSIADGHLILDYIRETAAEHGVDKKIHYRTRVTSASWSSAEALWTVHVEDTGSGATSTWTCRFLYACAGYYRYDEGYTPDWPGLASYGGQVVHPQHWPADFDATGKRVVVIGSGATAVTLVPAIADDAAMVTMLQRSPSYLMPLPATDPIATFLRKHLSPETAYRLIRWKNIKLGTASYAYCRKQPAKVRALLRKMAVKRLPEGFDVDKHFKPTYEPWDQRMCLTPDGDFYAAVRAGKAEVVTDHIESFTPTGIRLRSGDEIPADIVITATGLNLLPMGGVPLTVDGKQINPGEHLTYKGMMLDGVPNMALAMGYTNASWTLKVDLVSSYVARLLQTMKVRGHTVVTPRRPDGVTASGPFIEMTSGYFQRAKDLMPQQGDSAPWRLEQHYGRDSVLFTGPIDDPVLEFTAAPQAARIA